MANDNNRANQLNPTAQEFLDSRGCNLTVQDVAKIQSIESKTIGHQTVNGIGAEAQRRLNSIQNGTCS